MTSLDVSRTDFDQLLQVVGSFAKFRDLDALRHHTVSVLPSLVSTNAIAWNEVDTQRGHVEAVMEPAIVSEDLADEFVAHMADHPVIAHSRATGDGRPQAISDFLTTREFHATDLYQRFYRQIGAEDQISFVLPDPSVVIGIALNRPRRGFSDRERQLLNALRPHLVQAYLNAQDFTRLQRSLVGVTALVEQGGEGLIVLDRRGNPEHWTERATETFGRWFPDGEGRLPDAVVEWLDHSRRPLAPPMPLVVDRDDRHLMIRRVPVPDGQALLVAEVDAAGALTLLRRCGLTPREAEVLVLVTEGHTIGTTASRLAISPRTVEKHIQHSYDKLGLDNRVAATNFIRQLERGAIGGPTRSSPRLAPARDGVAGG
jgi:DNA-binding CsgD family transcriptional regulator